MSNTQQYPLMPKATARWLVENTALTFKQIAQFCGIHELEVKGMADGELATNIMPVDPVIAGQLEASEIERCSQDQSASLKLKIDERYEAINKKAKKRAKYTPIARRGDKPDAVYWMLKNYPEVKDSDIIKLIGTTKSTLEAIKDRSHWNMANLKQRDPVWLGLCSQADLDKVVEKANLAEAATENTDKTKK